MLTEMMRRTFVNGQASVSQQKPSGKKLLVELMERLFLGGTICPIAIGPLFQIVKIISLVQYIF
jgi:hypothetical protein